MDPDEEPTRQYYRRLDVVNNLLSLISTGGSLMEVEEDSDSIRELKNNVKGKICQFVRNIFVCNCKHTRITNTMTAMRD